MSVRKRQSWELLAPIRTPLIASLCLVLASCVPWVDDTPEDTLLQTSPDVLMQEATTSFHKHAYHHTINVLDGIIAYHPDANNLDQALALKMEASYRSKAYAQTQSTAEQYLHLFPQGHDAPKARYLQAISELGDGGTWLQRHWLPHAVADRDAVAYTQAFQRFKALVRRYPNSPYTQQAKQHMTHIRDLLAGYEFRVARFYADRGAPVAAFNRAYEVVTSFPGSRYEPLALELCRTMASRLDLPALKGRLDRLKHHLSNSAQPNHPPSKR